LPKEVIKRKQHHGGGWKRRRGMKKKKKKTDQTKTSKKIHWQNVHQRFAIEKGRRSRLNFKRDHKKDYKKMTRNSTNDIPRQRRVIEHQNQEKKRKKRKTVEGNQGTPGEKSCLTKRGPKDDVALSGKGTRKNFKRDSLEKGYPVSGHSGGKEKKPKNKKGTR